MYSRNVNVKYVKYTGDEGNRFLGSYVTEPLNRCVDFLQAIPPEVFPNLSKTSNDGNERRDVAELIETLHEIKDIYKNLGPYCGKLAAMTKQSYFFLSLQHKKRPVELTYQVVCQSLLQFVLRVNNVLSKGSGTMGETVTFVPDQQKRVLDAQLFSCITDKLKQLKDCVLAQFETFENAEEGFCGIVFVEKRLTAQVLAWYFQALTKDRSTFSPFGLHTAFLAGGAKDLDMADFIKQNKNEDEIIRLFYSGQIKLLIATPDLDEALLIQKCNYIVRFDNVNTHPSFQSIGQTINKRADFVLMIDEESYVDASIFQNFSAKLEECLSKRLQMSRELSGDTGSLKTDSNNLEFFAPFCPSGQRDGPIISANSAIHVVLEYCAKLPGDMFVTLAPAFWFEEEEIASDSDIIMYRGCIQFPSNSVIKAVVKGPAMPTKTLAKPAAYLKACEELYAHGGLGDDLLPKDQEMPFPVVEFFKSTMDQSEHRQKKEWHTKLRPELFSTRTILPKSCKLYKIQLETRFSKNPAVKSYDLKTLNNIYNFTNKSHCFGLLVDGNFDMIPKFVLDDKLGDVEFELLPIEPIRLHKSDISNLCLFQRFIYTEVLSLPLENATISDNPPLLLCPLVKDDSNNQNVNWELVSESIKFDKKVYLVPVPAKIRESWNCNERFDDAVVVPWYREDEYHMHCVSEVFHTMSPLSRWLNNDCRNYKEYYEKKYGLKVCNMKQPLIECVSISQQLNFLSVKHNTIALGSRNIFRDFTSVFIPELVRKHVINASLFAQARYLPSVLHRMERICIANEIKTSVANSFSWTTALNSNEKISVPELTYESKPKILPALNQAGMLSYLYCIEMERSTDICAQADVASGHDDVDPVDQQVKFLSLDYIHPEYVTTDHIERIASANRQFTSTQAETISDQVSKLKLSSIGIELIGFTDLPEFPSLDLKPDFKTSTGPSAFHIMKAITPVNGQAGMDLERFQIIGESFLKYSVSTQVFCNFPEAGEGVLSSIRNKLISSSHLSKIGIQKHLGEVLSGGFFMPRTTWLPPGFDKACAIKTTEEKTNDAVEVKGEQQLLEDEKSNITCTSAENVSSEANDAILIEENASAEKVSPEAKDVILIEEKASTSLSEDRIKTKIIQTNKTSSFENHWKHKQPVYEIPKHTNYKESIIRENDIAGCVEALVGAYFTSGGCFTAFRLMEWIGLRCPTNYTGATPLVLGDWTVPAKIQERTSLTSFVSTPGIIELQDFIGYQFKNPWLVSEAFSHPSYSCSNVDCYQRLEYIGEAVLDFLITNHIHSSKVDGKIRTIGQLTDLRAALVNNVTFGSLSVRYKFHNLLVSQSKDLNDAIDRFVAYQMINDDKVTGHFKLATEFDIGIVATDVKVPKVLGDIFESLAGAVFVDSGLSLDTTWKVFYRLLKSEIDGFSENVPISPVRELQVMFPGAVEFSIIDNPLAKANDFIMEASVGALKLKFRGVGRNSASAKQAAAKVALKHMKADSVKTSASCKQKGDNKNDANAGSPQQPDKSENDAKAGLSQQLDKNKNDEVWSDGES